MSVGVEGRVWVIRGKLEGGGLIYTGIEYQAGVAQVIVMCAYP